MPPFEISSGVLALSVVTSITAALALKYPDCALFDEHRENLAHPKGGVPILGNLLTLSRNKDRYFEYVVEIFESLDTMT